MPYKVELRYVYGWDDAGWTEGLDTVTRPTRFASTSEAEAALEAFFTEIRSAVRDGYMQFDADPRDYRIVPAND